MSRNFLYRNRGTYELERDRRLSRNINFYDSTLRRPNITDVLDRMLKPKYSGNISIELLYRQEDLLYFLSDVPKQTIITIKVILMVILKASEDSLINTDFRKLCELVISSDFSKKRLNKYICVELEEKTDFNMLLLLLRFLKLSFNILPGLAYDIFYYRVQNLKNFIDVLILKSIEKISNEIIDELNDLNELASSSHLQYENKKDKFSSRWTKNNDVDPPDDYRTISIFPSSQDLLDITTKDIFLRSNKASGVYGNVEHYLDVQFRLMREDFIQPLREGLQAYKRNDNTKRRNLRVYHNVTVFNTLPVARQGIITNLKFDISGLQKVKWEVSKRFIYGSLLCLSCDNFFTLIFATVANRDVNDLRDGYLCVKFIDSKPCYDIVYTLLETTNMFESYRHVLVKLQETNAMNLCMKEYLVFGERKVALPDYLDDNIEMEYVMGVNRFQPGDSETQWPTMTDLNFDSSQVAAFKNALTKKIALIQGPPGTGKTYLGLKICLCLLLNVQRNITNFGPILIVCYTNHALDQFLEGISAFQIRMLRIGNRSKSEIMEKYSLKNLRKNEPKNKEIEDNLNRIKDNIIDKQVSILCSYRRLMTIDALQLFLSVDYLQYFKDIGLKNWLNGNSSPHEAYDHRKVPGGNIVEQIFFEEIRNNMRKIAEESKNEMHNTYRYNCKDDVDNEVNYINNQRQLDIDAEGLGEINERLQSVLEDIDINEFNEGYFKSDCKNLDIITMRTLYSIHLRFEDKMSEEEIIAIKSIKDLRIRDRWRLYRSLRDKYVSYLQNNSRNFEEEYETVNNQLNEWNFKVDEIIMKNQQIIGMTTTGAARYSKILENVCCKIIIVEEAAEVLESHIISSLNLGCQHLILIGDHKQLKPNPAVYELAKKYQLDISLFERLINNSFEYKTLSVQHRMRPEIAEIVHFIYGDLQNHESVLKYPNVPSVGKNLYFLNHSEREKENEESMSFSNQFEAEFVVKFCLHLMKNGVKEIQITILTLYSGQMFLLRSLMCDEIYKSVRVCVVDNYQGEENDIILLSLVRSNEYEKIGFLSIENRICVSLSRAKHGLYVFGNFDILAKQNELWKKVCHFLKEKEMLGNFITLFCQNHPEKKTHISSAAEFNKCPEGGCAAICKKRLICGHGCRMPCHFMDINHIDYKCKEPCVKYCSNMHKCPLKCSEKCEPCQIEIEKSILGCNHTAIIPCSIEPTRKECPQQCGRTLKCNHKCEQPCKDRCVCSAMVEKILPECGHSGQYLCNEKNMFCKRPCNAALECGHKCQGTCQTCYRGHLHVSCEFDCESQLICGHVGIFKCNFYFQKCFARCEVGCSHHQSINRCGKSILLCTKPCEWKCGHKHCDRLCHQICDRDVCDERCKKYVQCTNCSQGFRCYGVCGEICMSVCFNCDKEVKKDFLRSKNKGFTRFIKLQTCGHSFEVTAMDEFMSLRSCGEELLMKRCPNCNKVITELSCFRYMNIIKILSCDIRAAQKIIDSRFQRFDLNYELNKNKFENFQEMFHEFNLINYFNVYFPSTKFLHFKFCTSLILIIEVYNRLYKVYYSIEKKIQSIGKSIDYLINWLNPHQRNFNEFEVNNFYSEFDRIGMCLRLNVIHEMAPYNKQVLDFISELEMMTTTFSLKIASEFAEKIDDFMRNEFSTECTLEENREKESEKSLCCQKCGSDIIGLRTNLCSGCHLDLVMNDDNRTSIIKEIGVGKGLWFKCSKGHLYVCQRVNGVDVSQCPQCCPKNL